MWSHGLRSPGEGFWPAKAGLEYRETDSIGSLVCFLSYSSVSSVSSCSPKH